MVTTEMQAMLTNDEHHWWYRGRRRIIRAVLDGCDLPADARVLDAGCGSGRTLDELGHYGHASGVDISQDAVDTARSRGHQDVRIGAIEEMPFDDASFDLVTCLDVVEHTPDDRRSLGELRRVTRPGGLLLVTVPAYQSLWSSHDEVNLHYRRYRSGTLQTAATDAGWAPVRDSYFNSLLLPPAAVVRLAERRSQRARTRSDLAWTPRWLDGLLEWPLRAEARTVGAGHRLPAGLSLMGLFRNTAQEPGKVVQLARARGTAPAWNPDQACAEAS
jgi:SAM-dependent methyltransferase